MSAASWIVIIASGVVALINIVMAVDATLRCRQAKKMHRDLLNTIKKEGRQ